MENEPERVKEKKHLGGPRVRCKENPCYNGGYNNVKGMEKVKVGGLRVEM